jgi:Sulfotransferase family
MIGMADDIKVLYIGGYSRSGSTLLLRLLGEYTGIVVVGELSDIWERSYIQNQLCGCGRGFRECPFWIDVTAHAFGCLPDEVPAGQLNDLRSRVQGHAKIPTLWLPEVRSASYKARVRTYASVLSRFYGAVREVSGSGIIIDSSKVPQYAWVLAEADGLEIHMIHLVRDSRATAFSWQRRRVRPEITSERTYMDVHSVVRSAVEWDVFNYLLSTRRTSYASYTLIRYEDLIANPRAELKRLMGALCDVGVRPTTQDTIPDHLGISHTASGNPDRFKVGQLNISLDAEWMQAMSGLDRGVVTALTAVGLVRYHYPLSASIPAGRTEL